MATALVLGRAGHTVFATMRYPYGPSELARIAREEQLPIHVHGMDVDSDASVTDAISAITEANGPLDVLVNNAGIACRGSIEELDLCAFRAVMETNYFGPLRCIKAVLPQMRARNSGCIINVSSVAGRIASSPLASYAASKFALEGLSEALAQEAKMFNIRVAIVQPGIIDTAMARSIGQRPDASPYPQLRRMAGLFAASLRTAASPFRVGEKICEIVDSGTWKFRHPIEPDAEPFLAWRASMTDEQWVDRSAVSDEEWYASVERDFGMKLQ